MFNTHNFLNINYKVTKSVNTLESILYTIYILYCILYTINKFRNYILYNIIFIIYSILYEIL